MTKFFRFISALFSPLVVPCYGLALSLCVTPLAILPVNVRLVVLGISALLLFIAPLIAILLLYRAGFVTDPGLNLRKERTIPYCATMLCYLICACYLMRIGAPLWLPAIIIGGCLAILINLIVNLRWKISGHMAGMGGLVAVTFFLTINGLAIRPMLWIVIAALLLAGLVGTARLALNRHTPMQVLCGSINGFLCVYLCAFLGLIL